jgi:hypothetical protein
MCGVVDLSAALHIEASHRKVDRSMRGSGGAASGQKNSISGSSNHLYHSDLDLQTFRPLAPHLILESRLLGRDHDRGRAPRDNRYGVDTSTQLSKHS